MESTNYAAKYSSRQLYTLQLNILLLAAQLDLESLHYAAKSFSNYAAKYSSRQLYT
jgi:hypothetical protein